MGKINHKVNDKDEITNKNKRVKEMSSKSLNQKQLKKASGGADDNYYLYFSDPSEEKL